MRHFVLVKLTSSSIGIKGRPFDILVAGLFLSPLSEPVIFPLMGEPEILNFKGQRFILCAYTFYFRMGELAWIWDQPRAVHRCDEVPEALPLSQNPLPERGRAVQRRPPGDQLDN